MGVDPHHGRVACPAAQEVEDVLLLGAGEVASGVDIGTTT